MSYPLRTIVGGLTLPEAPRWHDGALYLSDMHDGRVLRVEADGNVTVIAQFDAAVSGLGWLPDGSMLIVSMEARQVLRQEGNGFVVHANLSDIATYHANDMIVNEEGIAFVGNFGFSIHPPGEPCMAVLAQIAPSGDVKAAVGDLIFPNGMAINADESTLIVAESGGFRLTAFDIGEKGALTNRRVWAQLAEGMAPDGICLDAEGAVWVASPLTKQFVRVREGGEITDTIPVPDHALACVLGGHQRRTLYMMTSAALDPDECREKHNGSVLAVEVDVAGVGSP